MKKFFYIAVAFVSIAGNCATPATKPYVDSIVLGAKNEARLYTDSSVSNAYSILDKKIEEHTSDIYKDDSILIGHGAGTEGGINVVVGGEASATGMASVAVGNASYVKGNNAVAIGASSVATNEGAVAIGSGSTASHAGSIALGSGASSNGDNTFSVSVPFDKWYAGGESIVGFLTNEVEGVYTEWRFTSSTLDTSSMTVREEFSDGLYVYKLYQGTHLLDTKSNILPLTSISFSFVYEHVRSIVDAERSFIYSNNLGLLVGGDAIHIVSDKNGNRTAVSFGNPYGEFGPFSASFGYKTVSSGSYSHAEGASTIASGNNSHAEGVSSVAGGKRSHAEGHSCGAMGENSHAEGESTLALGRATHAEGSDTFASGFASHAGGFYTSATGDMAFAIGIYSLASDKRSFVWNSIDDVEDWTDPYYKSHGEGSFNINPLLGIEGFFVGEKNLKTIIEEVAPGGGGGGGVSEARVGEIATNCISHLDAHFANEVLAVQIDTNTVAQIGELKEFFDGLPVGSVGTSIVGIILALLAAVAWLKKHAKETDVRIDLIEATTKPNMNIVGSPKFSEGVVSGFSANDYLMFPTQVDVGRNTVEFYMSFTTGADVTTQQNLLDSWCGLAIAIQNRNLVLAVSSNGTEFETDTSVYSLDPNSSYKIRISFDYNESSPSQYTVRIYLEDDIWCSVSMNAPLHPTATYWGGANPQSGVHHIFGGTINLNECRMDWNGTTVWRGYDELPTVKFDPTAEPRLDTAEKIVGVIEDAVSLNNRFLVNGTTASVQTRADETAEFADEIRFDKGYDALQGSTMVKLDKSVQTVTVTGGTLTVELPDAVDGTVRDLCLYVNNTSPTETVTLNFPTGVTAYKTKGGADPKAAAQAGGLTAYYFTEIPGGAWRVMRDELEVVA